MNNNPFEYDSMNPFLTEEEQEVSDDLSYESFDTEDFLSDKEKILLQDLKSIKKDIIEDLRIKRERIMRRVFEIHEKRTEIRKKINELKKI